MNKRIIKILFTCLISVILAFSIFSVACESSAKDVYFTVIFNSDGGTGIPAQSVVSGKTATKPEDPTKDGYTFDGWFTEDGEYDFGSAVNGNITLKAKWTKNTIDPPPSTTYYTVTFDSNGGSKVSSDTVESGKTVNKPTDPTRDGYRFDGWYLGNTLYDFSTAVTDNTTLTAKWTKKSDTSATEYTVTFDSNGGSKVSPDTVESGKTVNKPTDPTRDGYRFDGWYLGNTLYDFSTAVTDNITLTAKWTEKSVTPPPPSTTYYTVTFDSNGGSKVSAQYVEKDKTAAEPEAPVRDGYRFTGWYSGAASYVFSAKLTSDLTLTAHWETADKYYTVKFVTNCESSITSQELLSGGKAVKPADPVNAGKVLAGWYSDSQLTNLYSFDTAVTKDITLYAKWSDDTSVKYFEVSFDTDGGSTVSAQAVESGKKAIEPTAPTKNNLKFDGWYTDGEHTQAYNFNTPVTGDITLYAKWSGNSGTTPPANKLTAISINFNGIELTDTIEKSDGTTYQGKNLEAGSVLDDKGIITLKDGQWEVDANNGKITDAAGNEVSVTKRLKSKNVRTMEIDLSEYTGKVKLQFFVRPASKNDLGTRGVSLSNAGGTELGKLLLENDAVTLFEVTVDCGSVYTLSVIKNGVNFYGINVLPVE